MLVVLLIWLAAGCSNPNSAPPEQPAAYPAYTITPSPTATGEPRDHRPADVVIALPTPTPELEQRLTVAAANYASAWVLTPQEFTEIMVAAGWPVHLLSEALAVAMCESGLSPWAVGDNGAALGLFQVHGSPWWRYAGESIEAWRDPLVQARVAWSVYNYDLAHGYPAWKQWQCKP